MSATKYASITEHTPITERFAAAIRAGRRVLAARIKGRCPPAKIDRLRGFGYPLGVTWLRDVLRENNVDSLYRLPEAKVDELLAGFEQTTSG